MQTDQIHTLIRERDWEELHVFLGRLSHGEFRRVERVVREETLAQLENDAFWEAYLHLVDYKRQAFLSAIRAARHLADAGTLRFDSDAARAVDALLSDSERIKVADMLLPLLHSEKQVGELLAHLVPADERLRTALLLRHDDATTYYHLFLTLRHCADPHPLALRCYRHLVGRNNDLATNMATILRAYFGLHESGAPFALTIHPYELSYLDQSFEKFRYTLEGKKPKN